MKTSTKLGVLGLTALAALLGCASLNVTVDVYVGDAVLRNHLAEQVAAIEESGLCRKGATDKKLEELLEQIEGPWMVAAKAFSGQKDAAKAEKPNGQKGGKGGTPGNAVEEPKPEPAAMTPAELLWSGVKEQITNAWKVYTADVDAVCKIEEQAKKVLTKTSAKTRNVPISLLVAQLNEAQSSASTTYLAIAAAIEYEAPARLIDQMEPIGFSVTAIASDDQTNGRVAGFPVFDPNIKHLLSDEPTELEQNNGVSRWKTSNKVRATANGGNSQFVLVQHGLMTFHQKSLDFDPSAVIAQVAEAARMGLQIASSVANAAGVPIPVNLGSGTSAPTSSAPSSEAPSSESIARVDHVIEARQKVVDRCMLDLSNFLHANEQVAAANVGAQNAKLEELIRKCQGNLDQVARP